MRAGQPRLCNLLRAVLPIVVVLLAFAFPQTAFSHQSSVVFLRLVPERHTLHVTLRIANSDLFEALGLPADHVVLPEDVHRQREQLTAYLLGRVSVANLGVGCPGRREQSAFEPRQGGFFAVETLAFECPRALEKSTLRYDLFFDLDPRHQGMALVELPGAPREYIFRENSRLLTLDQPRTVLDYALDYLRLGIEHIFTGYDHLAFVIGLLLLVGSLWRKTSPRHALGYILRVVTGFTVAHSLTLILSALRFVSLPSRWVESLIALSIGYVAIENIVGVKVQRRLWLAFGFGLVHGLGFASVLLELGLPSRGLVVSLLCFNLGVEVGQLTVVLLLLPLLALMSRSKWYPSVMIRGASWILLALSLIWFVERAFDMQWERGRAAIAWKRVSGDDPTAFARHEIRLTTTANRS